MSEKFDDKFIDAISENSYKMNVSGSVSKKAIPKILKEKTQEKIVIPIEEYVGMPTKSQIQAIKQYNLEQFPELFIDKNYDDDVDTKIVGLKSTLPAKLYSALLEAKIMLDLKKVKQVKRN